MSLFLFTLITPVEKKLFPELAGTTTYIVIFRLLEKPHTICRNEEKSDVPLLLV